MAVKPIDHTNDKLTGVRKIAGEGVIFKPKIERLQLEHGCTPDDLKDFVGPKKSLQRYQGVKQKIAIKKLEEKRAADREARTFQYAGIEVMTTSGLVNLTRGMADTLKKQIN